MKSGIRTIKMILERDYDLIVNLKKIIRIKKKLGLETIIRRRSKYRPLKMVGDEHNSVPNYLDQNFTVSGKDQIYSTDITYLNYGSGKRAYLSAIKDLYTKEILHYHVSTKPDLELAMNGLDRFYRQLPTTVRRSLLVHSDQGSHYTSVVYRNLLEELEVMQSMSRKGNCLDNAPIESFFGHMKDELDLAKCQTTEDLKDRVDKFIDYYNNQRPQWGLKRKTPAEYRGLNL